MMDARVFAQAVSFPPCHSEDDNKVNLKEE